MTKTDRAKLSRQGKTILRAKINRFSRWKVCQYTNTGGWKNFPGDYEFKRQDGCESFIDALVASDPNFLKDE